MRVAISGGGAVRHSALDRPGGRATMVAGRGVGRVTTYSLRAAGGDGPDSRPALRRGRPVPRSCRGVRWVTAAREPVRHGVAPDREGRGLCGAGRRVGARAAAQGASNSREFDGTTAVTMSYAWGLAFSVPEPPSRGAGSRGASGGIGPPSCFPPSSSTTARVPPGRWKGMPRQPSASGTRVSYESTAVVLTTHLLLSACRAVAERCEARPTENSLSAIHGKGAPGDGSVSHTWKRPTRPCSCRTG